MSKGKVGEGKAFKSFLMITAMETVVLVKYISHLVL
jgi:hypothetical protein